MFIFVIRNWFEALCVHQQSSRITDEHLQELDNLYHSVY